MSTDIAFLQDLRADLMKAATRASTAAPRRSLSMPKLRGPVPRWKLAGGLVTGVVVVAGVVGYVAGGGPGLPMAANPRGVVVPAGSVDQSKAVLHEGVRLPGTTPDDANRASLRYEAWTDTTAGDLAGSPVVKSPASVDGVPAIGPNIVKTGAIDLQVERHAFGEQFQRAMDVAESYGGYVQTSSTSGTSTRSGSMTMRVPADKFSLAVGDLRALGTVLHQEVTGVDVTAQFVDLGARLKNAEAQEASLRKLLAVAPTVDATLKVNRVLSDTELKIEELQGQLRVLANRADLGTIHVQMEEKGAPQVAPPVSNAVPKPKLGRAFDKGVAGFLGVVFSVVVGLGYLLPVIAFALVAWFVVRRVRRARVATA